MKGVLVDGDGRVSAHARDSYRVDYPRPGWAEQDPSVWRVSLARVVRALVARAAIEPADVSAIGLACQVDGLVAVDADLRPVAPAMIWMDRRATHQTNIIRQRMNASEIRAITGLNIDASHVAPKIMWLREACPELTRDIGHYLVPGSYLVGVLTGELVTDPANASSTMLYDVRNRVWSPLLLDLAGVEHEQLAHVRAAHAIAGVLRPDAAADLGLTERCQVVVGTGDEHAASLAAGAIRDDIVCDITGTAEPVAVGTTRFVVDPTGLVETHAHADERAWLIENPGFVSGGSVRWFLDTFGGDEASLDEAGAVAAGSDGVTFLPTMSGATTPVWNERARGVYGGLGLGHGRAHLARALLEGCTFALRDLVDRFAELGLGRSELRVVGGGARSELWLQMKADVTDRVVRVLETPDATAVGGAQLAGVGVGLFRDVDEAIAALTVVHEAGFEPDPSNRGAYDDAYGRYRRLFDAVAPTFS